MISSQLRSNTVGRQRQTREQMRQTHRRVWWLDDGETTGETYGEWSM